MQGGTGWGAPTRRCGWGARLLKTLPLGARQPCPPTTDIAQGQPAIAATLATGWCYGNPISSTRGVLSVARLGS